MILPHIPVESFEDATQNFEQIQQQRLYTGSGAPTFTPSGRNVSFYFRTDTPTVANQRIYVYNGTTWTGIV